jgi:hypothetical protein
LSLHSQLLHMQSFDSTALQLLMTLTVAQAWLVISFGGWAWEAGRGRTTARLSSSGLDQIPPNWTFFLAGPKSGLKVIITLSIF